MKHKIAIYKKEYELLYNYFEFKFSLLYLPIGVVLITWNEFCPLIIRINIAQWETLPLLRIKKIQSIESNHSDQELPERLLLTYKPEEQEEDSVPDPVEEEKPPVEEPVPVPPVTEAVSPPPPPKTKVADTGDLLVSKVKNAVIQCFNFSI